MVPSVFLAVTCDTLLDVRYSILHPAVIFASHSLYRQFKGTTIKSSHHIFDSIYLDCYFFGTDAEVVSRHQARSGLYFMAKVFPEHCLPLQIGGCKCFRLLIELSHESFKHDIKSPCNQMSYTLIMSSLNFLPLLSRASCTIRIFFWIVTTFLRVLTFFFF